MANGFPLFGVLQKDCGTILTKACTGDTECVCYGFYYCSAGRCKDRTASSPNKGQYFSLSFPSGPASVVLRTQSLKVLFLKPGVGQYIAIYATLTARDFFLAYYYPSGPLTCILFPKPLPSFFFFFPVLAVANTGSCVGPWMQVPVLRARGIQISSKSMTCGRMTREMNNLEIE